jgi:ATP-dependent exoDNAse (exonuclease V) beta subunit
MKLIFNSKTHTYLTDDNQEYLSVTKLISKYKQPFNQIEAANKASRNRRGKWFNIPADQIIEVWNQEAERSITLGNWYHDQREKDVLGCETLSYEGFQLPVHHCLYNEEGLKEATEQRIPEGVYPEFFLYLPSAGIAGQSDRVTIANGKVDILDYKTNKEIKTQGFRNFEGITQKLLYPLSHLDDCNLNHYTIQLSIYMYIILKHNPMYTPGTLTLQHVIFEEDYDKNPYGYPIYLRDNEGNPIVKDVIQYKLPYLKDEVLNLLDHYKSTK